MLIIHSAIGVVFGLACAIALSPAFAALHTGASSAAATLAYLSIAVVIVACAFAPTLRRAFGRGFLLLGASVFALPISALMLSGRAAGDVISASNDGATAIGAGLGAIAITGVATFFGLIVGTILLLVGLVLALGGRREVVIVDKRQKQAPAPRRDPPLR